MMAGNPNWWSMNSMHPQFSSQFVFGSNSSLSSIPSESDHTHHHQDFPARSWSQLLRGGLAANEEENRFDSSLFQQHRKLQENLYQDLQDLNLNPSFSRNSVLNIKQDSDSDYDHHHRQFEANRSSHPSINNIHTSWPHQLMPVSSPTSCTTNLSHSLLSFSGEKAAAATGAERKHHLHSQEHSSECDSSGNGGVPKKARVQQSSPQPALKVRKEKLGDRITALHQIVSPFGKTDTASVLSEAIRHIRFLHAQIEALAAPYMRNSSANTAQHSDSNGARVVVKDLRSRGLCLVPISYTQHVENDNNGVDYWAPPSALGGAEELAPRRGARALGHREAVVGRRDSNDGLRPASIPAATNTSAETLPKFLPASELVLPPPDLSLAESIDLSSPPEAGLRGEEISSTAETHKDRILRIDQDEARLAARGCTWYEIKASTLRQSDIPSIRDKAGIADLYEIVIPHVHARAHCPLAGFHTFYVNQIERGLRFPVPRFITDLCNHLEISPSQLTPNSFSSLLSLGILLKFFKIPLSSYTLMRLVQIKRLGPGKFYISNQCVSGNPSSHKGWMSRYFFIKRISSRENPWDCDMSWRDNAYTQPPSTPEPAPELTVRATRGGASAELGFVAEQGRAYIASAELGFEIVSAELGLSVPSWSGLCTHVEELREECGTGLKCAELVGLMHSRRRATRGGASAELGFVAEQGRAYIASAELGFEIVSAELGLSVPSWSGLCTHVEELREECGTGLKCAELVGLMHSRRRATRGGASAELGFVAEQGRAYIASAELGFEIVSAELGLSVPSWSGLCTHVEELREECGTGLKCAELVGLMHSRRRATRGGASAELGFVAEQGRAYIASAELGFEIVSAELGLSVPSWSGLCTHVEELREECGTGLKCAELVGLMHSRRRATRGGASAELGFVAEQGRAYIASAELGFEIVSAELGLSVPSWSGLCTHVEELREECGTGLKCAELVGLMHSRRRATRGGASADLGFVAEQGRAYIASAELGFETASAELGLSVPSWSGLCTHVEELREEVPVRNWAL
ncbi:hypothetical protein F511_31260 [Dorcoceras hygrometricum]|uniref:BHLH domain-containing protein n=1 Tax=Dorcoceras hygrometricum TaxID=472368 RepID=A0A2Z7D0H5_9LAMI|nr:hypothetical protein F511_31260 [Dorcoceras hygrometricum]